MFRSALHIQINLHVIPKYFYFFGYTCTELLGFDAISPGVHELQVFTKTYLHRFNRSKTLFVHTVFTPMTHLSIRCSYAPGESKHGRKWHGACNLTRSPRMWKAQRGRQAINHISEDDLTNTHPEGRRQGS